MKRQSRILALALIILLIVSVFTSCSLVDKLKEGMGGVTAAISQVKNTIMGFFNPNYDPKPGTTTTTPAGCDHVWYAPTCTEPQTCSECGETKGEALGHSETELEAVAPTCTEDGKTAGTVCSRCNTVLVAQEVVPATGHNDTVVVTLEPTCLTPGVQKLTCSVCGFDRTEGIDPLGHEYDSVVTDPTCSERGYTTHTCKREGCDHSFVDNYLDALGHDHSVKTVVKDSTCVEKGTLRYSCSRCDDYYDEEIAMKEHSFVETVTTEPGCLTAGVLTTTCTGCDYHKETPIAATGHKNSLEDGATCTDADVCTVCGEELEPALTHKWVEDKGYAATCTEKGLTDGKHCERCGHIEVAQEEIPAPGHKFGEWATTLAPTCTTDGSERRDCDACDHFESRVLVATGHKYGEWATTLAPTCTTDGSERRDCDACDHYEENVLAALGHDYKMTTVDPTCEENGYDSYDCTRCDDSYIKNQKPAPGHTWVKGTTVAPNCTEQGYTNYSCFCGAEKKDDYVSATGHTYEDVVTAPTCTEMGYTTHTCDCGDVVVDTYTSAKGHSWGTGSVTTESECGVEGERTYTCSCGETRTEAVEALEHIYDAVVTAPTCTEDGYTTHTCRLCGYGYEDSKTAATGHDYDAEVTAPTCEAGGYTTHTCRLCGDDYVDSETAATGHDYDAAVTAPTCTEEGYTTYTCHCGDSYVSDEVNALGHDMIVDAAVAPTCTATGLTEGSHCSRCDHKVAQEVVSATGHAYDAVVTAPNCVNGGYTTYTCSACAHSYIADLTPATDHKMTGEWVITEAPSCDETGIATLACKNGCGYELTRVVGATGHTFGQAVIENKVDPDCVNQGSYDKVIRCTVCGHVHSTEHVTVDALGHTYVKGETVAPTCNAEGYTVYTCSACGDSYHGDITPAKHSLVAVETKAPTCTEYGYTVYGCEHCDHTEIGSYEAALGHDYSEATCTEPATCGRCDETTDAPLGHDIVIDNAVAPTCTETGLTAGSHCSRCDAILVAQEEVAALGHTGGESFYRVDDGVLYLIENPCSRCDYEEKSAVDEDDVISVDNAADLQTVIGAGVSVKLTDDVTLDGILTIDGEKDVVLDLNGKTVTADKVVNGVNEVILATNGAKVVIRGNGTLIANGTEGSVNVVSAIHGATVTIENGTFISGGCSVIYAQYEGATVNIYGGHFEALQRFTDGRYYVLDVDERNSDMMGTINVYGGEFVGFDPANHTNDGSYSNKLADGYHSINNEGIYTVSEHIYESVVTEPTCQAGGYTTHTCYCGDSYKDAQTGIVDHNMVKADAGYYECSYGCGRVEVDDEAGLRAAIAKGGEFYVMADFTVDGDNTIMVSGTSVMNLGDYVITAVSDQIGANRNVFDVRGSLTVNGGKITLEHTGADMSWNNSTNVFNVTAGGVLTLNGTHVENLGGSSMAFGVHLNNWGEVTLNAEGATIKSTYVAVRVFNSGYDKNNLNIKGTTLQGASNALWVHNYTLVDFGNDTAKHEAAKARLNFEIFDGTNTFIGNEDKPGPIRYGFTNSVYYDGNGEHVHAYTSVVTAPTCLDGGYTTHTCNCGENYKDAIVDALGHDYDEWIIDSNATCTEYGSKHRVCDNGCGVDEVQSIPPTGHTDGEVVVEHKVDATCTTGGSYDNVTYCTVCGVETSREHKTVDALGHTAGSAVVENNVAADCDDAGSYDSVTYCTVCGVETSRATVTVDALGHTPEEMPAVDATCTETGLLAGAKCSVCGEILKSQTETEALGHNWGAYVVTRQPTCSDEGSETRTCGRCGATEVRNITSTGTHVAADSWTVILDPTCSATGVQVKYCKYDCGTVCETETLGVTDHNYVGVEITAPTCTTTGKMTYTCAGCEDTYDVVTEALGHDITVLEAVAPTYTNTGLTEGKTCSICGPIQSQRVVDKLTEGYTYLKPGDWNQGGAWFAAWVWGSSQADAWYIFKDLNGDGVFEAKLPSDATGMKLLRMESSATETNMKNWTKYWNNTGDISIPTNENCISITGWGESDWSWSNYDPSTFTYTVTGSGSHLGAEWTPSHSANDMEFDSTINAWVKIYTGVAAGDYAFKVAFNHSWNQAFPSADQSYTVSADNSTVVFVYYFGAGKVHVYQTSSASAYAVRSMPESFGATCVSEGRIKYTCNCSDGCEYYQMIDKTGHTNVEHSAQDATCVQYGHEAYIECSVCHYSTYERIGKKPHSLTLHEAKEASCKEAGWNEHYDCDNCDYTTKEVITVEHNWETVEEQGATCISPGWAAHQYCPSCGTTSEHETYEELGHDEISHGAKVPTCTEGGWEAYVTCSRCEYNTQVLLGIDKNNHTNIVTDEAVGATCTSTGLTEGKHCEACGTVTVKQETVEMLEHSYTVLTNTVEATCSKTGSKTWKCASCDDTDMVELPIDENAHSGHETDYKCDLCSKVIEPAGSTLTIAQAIALANALEVGNSTTNTYTVTGVVTEIQNPTYGNLLISDGEKTFLIYGTYVDGTRYDDLETKPVVGDTITVSGAVLNYNGTPEIKNGQLVSLVAHEHKYNEVITEPSCTTDGYTTYTCSVCQDSYTDTPVPATGHTTESGVCGTCGQTIGGQVTIEVFTITFDDTSKRSIWTSSQQVWEENGITVTNNKTEDSSAIVNNYNPIRLYKSSELIIECAGMTKLVFNCNTATYATALGNSIEGSTVNDKQVTVEFATASDSFTIILSGGQVRLDSIEVHAQPACEHTLNATPSCNVPATCTKCNKEVYGDHVEETILGTPATCTESGLSDGKKCSVCETVLVSQTTISPTGHTGGTATCKQKAVCSECGEEYGNLGNHSFVGGTCSTCGEKESTSGTTALSNATLSFESTANRTSQTTSEQVWEQNGITLTNNKSSSTSSIGNYSNPARFYANSEIIIEGAGMTKIVFVCGSTTYATALKNSITEDGVTVSVSGSNVTVTFAEAVDIFTIAKLSAQVRIKSLTVN